MVMVRDLGEPIGVVVSVRGGVGRPVPGAEGAGVLLRSLTDVLSGGVGGSPLPTLLPVPKKFLLDTGGGLINLVLMNSVCCSIVFASVAFAAFWALVAVLGLKRNVGETCVVCASNFPVVLGDVVVLLPVLGVLRGAV